MIKRIALATILLSSAGCRTTNPNQDFPAAYRPGLVETAQRMQEPSGTNGKCSYQSEKWAVLILRDAIVIRPDAFHGTWMPDFPRREFNYSEEKDGKVVAYLTTAETVYILTSNGWIFATSPGKESKLYKQEIESGWTSELSMKRFCLGGKNADIVLTIDGKELFVKYLGNGTFDIF